MITDLKFLRVTVCLFGLIAGLFSSAVRADLPANEARPAKLRFLFLDETPGTYSLKVGSTFRQISTAPYAISSPINVPAKGRLEIYQTSAQPDPVTGKKELLKIASLTPPDDLVSALVVVKPASATAGANTKAAPAITYFDTETRAFPAGGIRVINLGRAALGTQLDKNPSFQLQPGETRIVTPTPDSKNRVVVKIAVSEGDSWKLLSNKIAMLKPGQRMTGIFVYSPSGLRHTYTPEELAEFGNPLPGHFWLTYTDTP